MEQTDQVNKVAPDYSTPQLTLNMRQVNAAHWQNFDFAGAPHALATLQTLVDRPNGLVFMQGQRGTGKTHLLQATVTNAQDTGKLSAYIDASELMTMVDIDADHGLESLEGYDGFALLAIDDIEQLCAHPQWSQWLFHLYNRLLDNGGSLLLASRFTPRNLPCALADLSSRLHKAEFLAIQPINEAHMQTQLQLRAHQLGLTLSAEVTKYICMHSPRSMKDLMIILLQLDTASWQRQRKITIPFIKQTLHW